MPSWKPAVASAFDRAEGYEAAAATQAIVADRLAATILRQDLPPVPRVLEIGCGTGLLTRRLREAFPASPLLVTDLAPAMVARCRARMPDETTRFLVMDAERPCLRPGFDLVASSLAAQWFEDLPGTVRALSGLLAPRGLLAVTTLAAGTFREWAEAHAGEGLASATPAYPSGDGLTALACEGCAVAVSVAPVVEAHADGRAFLRSLRAIGAATPGADRSLTPGALRRVLRRFDAGGARVTYEVATLLIRRR
ncbi:methyltransferase domain-containing protein [uncultured Methylobacterium sp.]|uniref:methyltransferase domain-containing protein n=1 Tax=uncultured Methylobacterium sp. TaxID=157278 RepID=UPI0035CB9CA3